MTTKMYTGPFPPFGAILPIMSILYIEKDHGEVCVYSCDGGIRWSGEYFWHFSHCQALKIVHCGPIVALSLNVFGEEISVDVSSIVTSMDFHHKEFCFFAIYAS